MEELPSEVVEKILIYVDEASIRDVCLTCSSFFHLCSSSLFWRTRLFLQNIYFPKEIIPLERIPINEWISLSRKIRLAYYDSFSIMDKVEQKSGLILELGSIPNEKALLIPEVEKEIISSYLSQAKEKAYIRETMETCLFFSTEREDDFVYEEREGFVSDLCMMEGNRFRLHVYYEEGKIFYVLTKKVFMGEKIVQSRRKYVISPESLQELAFRIVYYSWS